MNPHVRYAFVWINVTLTRNADHQGNGKAYETFGIDREEGALIVVRPDNCECCTNTTLRANYNNAWCRRRPHRWPR